MSIKGVIGALSLYLLSFAFSFAQGSLPPPGEDWVGRYTNGIAAVVNSTIITVDELRDELAPMVKELRGKVDSEAEFNERLESMSFELLRNLINRSLIIKDFEEQGYSIPIVYIDKEYTDYITKEFNGDRERFLKWLKSEGKTTRLFREELANKMIVDYMRGRMRKSESAVSPVKIKAYYEKNKKVLFYQKEGIYLKQIMLAPIANESTELLVQEAEKILERLRQGVPFDELAREHSQDDMAQKGGDYGWIGRNELAPELSKVAFELAENEYSKPIVKDGYVFIFYVKEKRNNGVQPLSKVQDQIETVLAGESARKARKVWLERLRENAYIRYYL